MSSLRGDPLFILTLLAALIALSEWLMRRTALRHIGSALLVIILGAIVANLGLIPAGSTAEAPTPVYDAIFAHVAPISLFWLLLAVNLRDVLRVGLPMLALFLLGAAGTVAGVLIGMRVVGGTAAIGAFAGPVGGMFAGTYIGGSVNFNAVALHYDVMRQGALYAGTVVVDNVITAVWIAATLALPRLLAPRWPRRTAVAAVAVDVADGRPNGAPAMSAAPIVELAAERETLDPLVLALVVALGGAAQVASLAIARAAAAVGVTLPAILVISALALLLAQIPAVARLAGPRVLGMVGVYLFLTVIGAFCDVRALGALGSLGAVLGVVAATTVVVHGLVTFGAAWLLRLDVAAAAVASQANIGGGDVGAGARQEPGARGPAAAGDPARLDRQRARHVRRLRGRRARALGAPGRRQAGRGTCVRCSSPVPCQRMKIAVSMPSTKRPPASSMMPPASCWSIFASKP